MPSILNVSSSSAGSESSTRSTRAREQRQPGLRPAPYLASRGLKWIQHFEMPGLSDDELKEYLRHAHQLIAKGLSKKKRKELGLETG